MSLLSFHKEMHAVFPYITECTIRVFYDIHMYGWCMYWIIYLYNDNVHCVYRDHGMSVAVLLIWFSFLCFEMTFRFNI